MGDEIMDESFQILMEYLAEDLENITGPPFSITEEWDREANRTSFRVCIPVDSDLPGNDIVLKDRSYEGKVIKAVYQGPFEGIEMTYNAIQAKIVEEGYETAGEPIETYLTDPDLEPNPSK
jgi:effector-binding domain-containing protein